MKDGRITFISALIFVLVGAALWCAAGTLTGITSFEYIGGISTEKHAVEQETKQKYITPPHIMAGGLWAICGAGIGILILLSYTARQKEDYFTPIPAFLTRVPLFRIFLKFVRLKTFAEAKTVPLVSFLFMLGGVLLPLLVLPKLATSETVIIRSAAVRIYAGFATTGFATMFILPFSLWLLSRFIPECKPAKYMEIPADTQNLGHYFTQGVWFTPYFSRDIVDKFKPKQHKDVIDVILGLALLATICLPIYFLVTQGWLPCFFVLCLLWMFNVTLYKFIPAQPPHQVLKQEYSDLVKASEEIRTWIRKYYIPGKILKKGEQLREKQSAQSAIKVFKEAVSRARESRDYFGRDATPADIAMLYIHLGFLQRMMNQWDDAVNSFRESLVLSERSIIPPSIISYDLNYVIAAYSLAEVNEVCGKLAESIDEYRKSLERAKYCRDWRGVAVIEEQLENCQKMFTS
jgi:hypothetical protein